MGGLIPGWSVALLLVVAVVAANLPFLSERLFALGPRRAPKAFWWRVLEWLVYSTLVALLGRAIESHLGQTSPVRWEFVAVWVCVMATLAFPGFVWRHLRRGA
ncbi:DUF2818 family protein [Aquabacterium fontiphilum]|jgi:hypothetical protein|uniref:DUF2818 family protein n=1 Tax=Aquabacterium fontiphilum TaxID=450365 RepID=UPI0013790985|nr:DUF2818 family protein [Aquabacterium fontiphilum]NBD21304.1 DUF2818 family protein [Aquabacterium fontiphilum]